jgi:hydrogenase maturation protease
MNILKTDTKTIIIGIGNNGRGDDALGWQFIDQVTGLTPYDVEYRYQLQIEDAALIRGYDIVIFVDATSRRLKNGFSFEPCTPENLFTFTTHKIEPGYILWLCKELYGKMPIAYTMAIQGINWELRQGLSVEARKNFDRAVTFFKQWLKKDSIAVSY